MKELDRIESLGVISRIDQLTPRCVDIVVISKKIRNVRIRVNLRSLNTNIQREVYPLSIVDETLTQLSGATVFLM